ncbi:Rv1733c family protein [Streptomyces bobili]|uniref:Rv1733c family protein n=1 Tax=Streptomyces bobili TaxID=67280 RepID=UPI003F4DA34C
MRGNRSEGRLWRWRRNPLRRRTDVVEAWIMLVLWTVVLVGGTLAGLMTAHAAVQASARERAERHAVAAVVLADVPRATTDVGNAYRMMTEVRWAAPDGTSRTGRTLVKRGTESGATITVWQNDRGALTPQPTGATEGAVEAAFFGGSAALAVACAALGIGALTRRGLDQGRLARWATEWELIGPRWSERTS